MDRETLICSLVERIGVDANAATELLALASEYLENGETLPDPVAKFLGSAFRRATEEPSAQRAETLAYELGFAAPAKQGAPPKPVDYGELRGAIVKLFANGRNPSEREVNTAIAQHFGISATTARKHTKPDIVMSKILRHNEMDSLVRPRNPKAE